MKRFLDPQLQGAFRHLLTSVGPLLAAKGLTDEIMWQLWVGVLMASIGFYASWKAPEKQE